MFVCLLGISCKSELRHFKITSVFRSKLRWTTKAHFADAEEDAVSFRNFVAASAARGFRATHCRTGVPWCGSKPSRKAISLITTGRRVSRSHSHPPQTDRSAMNEWMNDPTASGQICDYILTTKQYVNTHWISTQTRRPNSVNISEGLMNFLFFFLCWALEPHLFPHSSCLALSQCVVSVCIDMYSHCSVNNYQFILRR